MNMPAKPKKMKLTSAQREAIEYEATPYRSTAEALVRKGVWSGYSEGWDTDGFTEYTPSQPSPM